MNRLNKSLLLILTATPEASHPVQLPNHFLSPKIFATAFGLIPSSSAFSTPKGERLKMLGVLGGFAALAFISTVSAESVVPSERLQRLMAEERSLVIAHRGYSMAAPENTLPAFRLGLLARADLVELDYFHSREGVPVVMHDPTLDRTTNAPNRWGGVRIPVTSKTVAELRELDAGTWFDPRFAGVRVPTLAESLDVIQTGSITLVERKHGNPRTIVDLLKKKEMLNDVVIQAFDWEFIAGCHAIAPGVVLGALGPPRRPDGSHYPVAERVLNHAFLDQIEATGSRVVVWNRQVTPESIAEAHRRGMKVWVYTINELDKALSFLEMGIDGIISDNPAMVWKAHSLHQTRQAK